MICILRLSINFYATRERKEHLLDSYEEFELSQKCQVCYAIGRTDLQVLQCEQETLQYSEDRMRKHLATFR